MKSCFWLRIPYCGRVIETVVKEYTPDGAQINSISVDKALESTKDLKRGEEAPTVLTEEEAVNIWKRTQGRAAFR